MTIDFRARKKEIIVASVYIVIFLILFLIINSLNSKKEELEFEEETKLYEYNRLVNNTVTLEELNNEYEQLELKVVELGEKLPVDLDNQKSSMVVNDFVNNNSELLKRNYIIDEPQKMSGDLEGIEYVRVRVEKYYGTFEDIKRLLKYISNYNIKSDIGNVIINNTGMIDGDFEFYFYGRSKTQE